MRRAVLVLALLAAPAAEAGPVLDRIAGRGEIRFGVRTDAPPFASIVDGEAQGFTVDLCVMLAASVAREAGVETLLTSIVPVDTGERFDALIEGRIDVLCGATTVTVERQQYVDFTIPIFATGVAALVSYGAPDRVREALLAGDLDRRRRAALAGAVFGARAETTAEAWLRAYLGPRVRGLGIVAMPRHDAGIAAVDAGEIDAYFADLAILQGQLTRLGRSDRSMLSSVPVTYEPYALAIPPGDDDLRIALNRGLLSIFRSDGFLALYEAYFGPPTREVQLFYRTDTLTE